MGIFSRFRDIINSNINALLDKAEDPAKMLKLMLQEMEDTLIELKSDCAAKMAAKIGAERKYKDQLSLVERWTSRAKMAVERQRDDLAREALIEKRNESAKLISLEENIKLYSEMIEKSKEDISTLEDKLSSLKQKLRVLKEKEKVAEKEKEINSFSKEEINLHFENLESKVDRMFSDNELNNAKPTTSDKFESLEELEEIERELSELKGDL